MLLAGDWAAGENLVGVRNAAGESVATYTIHSGEPEPTVPSPALTLGISLAVLVAIALVATAIANRKKQ